jgi:hypothetical protein
MTQQYTMSRKQKGSGLQPIQKKVVKKEHIPSPPAEELLLPVDNVADDQEHHPDKDFSVNKDNTYMILKATSNKCMTLNAQATQLAIAYYFLNVLRVSPLEEWDGMDGTVVLITNALKDDTDPDSAWSRPGTIGSFNS